MLTVRDTAPGAPSRADGRGRGLVMMRALMDHVDVTPRREGTTVGCAAGWAWRTALSMPDRVFVTGALGFIGRALADRYARARAPRSAAWT